MYLTQTKELSRFAPQPIVLTQNMLNDFHKLQSDLMKSHNIRFDLTMFGINNSTCVFTQGIGFAQTLYFDQDEYDCYQLRRLPEIAYIAIREKCYAEFASKFKIDISTCTLLFPSFEVKCGIEKFIFDINYKRTIDNSDTPLYKCLYELAKFIVECHNSLLK